MSRSVGWALLPLRLEDKDGQECPSSNTKTRLREKPGLRESRSTVARLVVFHQRERLALDALANNSAADALSANARGRGPTFRLLNVDGLEIDEVMAFGDAGRLAAVAAQVFGLATFDLGVTSASSSFANVTHQTHDDHTLFETEIFPAFRFERREYIAPPPTCKTRNGCRFT